jgi:hypothetical protein
VTTMSDARPATTERWTEYRQIRDNDAARAARGGPSREEASSDSYYRDNIGKPERMTSLGSDVDRDHEPPRTVAEEKASMQASVDRQVTALSEAGVPPEAIYVQMRSHLAATMAAQMQRDVQAAELLSYRGVSAETLTAYMQATIDAGDAVVADLRDRLLAPQAADPRQERAESLREHGVPETAIAAQMRAGAAAPSATTQAAPSSTTVDAPQTRIARLAARVTGRSASHDAAQR